MRRSKKQAEERSRKNYARLNDKKNESTEDNGHSVCALVYSQSPSLHKGCCAASGDGAVFSLSPSATTSQEDLTETVMRVINHGIAFTAAAG